MLTQQAAKTPSHVKNLMSPASQVAQETAYLDVDVKHDFLVARGVPVREALRGC